MMNRIGEFSRHHAVTQQEPAWNTAGTRNFQPARAVISELLLRLRLHGRALCRAGE